MNNIRYHNNNQRLHKRLHSPTLVCTLGTSSSMFSEPCHRYDKISNGHNRKLP